MERSDLEFVNLGDRAYYALVDGLTNGVLYWTTHLVVEDGTAEWYWVPAVHPHQHHGLLTPPLLVGMTQEQVEANTALAMEALYRHLSGASSGA